MKLSELLGTGKYFFTIISFSILFLRFLTLFLHKASAEILEVLFHCFFVKVELHFKAKLLWHTMNFSYV